MHWRHVITTGHGRMQMSTRGRIVEWQRRRWFYGAIAVAYKSLVTRNERPFSLASPLKSLPMQVVSDYWRRSWGRLCVVIEQSVYSATKRAYFRTIDTNAPTVFTRIGKSPQILKKKLLKKVSLCFDLFRARYLYLLDSKLTIQ